MIVNLCRWCATVIMMKSLTLYINNYGLIMCVKISTFVTDLTTKGHKKSDSNGTGIWFPRDDSPRSIWIFFFYSKPFPLFLLISFWLCVPFLFLLSNSKKKKGKTLKMLKSISLRWNAAVRVNVVLQRSLSAKKQKPKTITWLLISLQRWLRKGRRRSVRRKQWRAGGGGGCNMLRTPLCWVPWVPTASGERRRRKKKKKTGSATFRLWSLLRENGGRIKKEKGEQKLRC